MKNCHKWGIFPCLHPKGMRGGYLISKADLRQPRLARTLGGLASCCLLQTNSSILLAQELKEPLLSKMGVGFFALLLVRTGGEKRR